MDKATLIRRIVQRRARGKRLSEHTPFESVSIGDIAFLLLIFFIVTSSFVLREGIFFSLPSRNSTTVRLTEDQIAEVAPADDGFSYRGKVLSRETFVREMKEFIRGDRTRVLIIAMAPDVKYDRLVDTLSVARETGIRRVSVKNTTGGGR
ncbi:MAG: biopolymer transporter ExbD [Spirochaetes bacterium]|nr:biopolymer transporter ExbD [Spirochaetota bacterium]